MAGLSYLGALTVGAVVPVTADAVAAALAELQAKLAGLANVQIALTLGPPSLAASVLASAQVTAKLAVAVAGPTVTLQAAAQLQLIASLTAQVEALIAVSLVLGTPGIHAWTYGGDVGQFGPLLGADIAGRFPASNPSAGVVLLAQTPTAAAALATALGATLAVESTP